MKMIIDKLNSLKLTSKILLALTILWVIFLTSMVFWGATYSGKGQMINPLSQRTITGGQINELATFNKIDLRVPAKLSWQPGELAHCTSNIDAPDFKLLVKHQTLILDEKKKSWFSDRKSNVILSCTSPQLFSGSVNGTGEININGIETENLSLTIDGTGAIYARGQVGKLNGEINGLGSFKLKYLLIDFADIEINGNGKVKIPAAKKAAIEINGMGSVEVSAKTEILKKDINGKGDIIIAKG